MIFAPANPPSAFWSRTSHSTPALTVFWYLHGSCVCPRPRNGSSAMPVAAVVSSAYEPSNTPPPSGLCLLFGPDDRFRTVRATIRRWRNFGPILRGQREQRPFGRSKPGQEDADRIIEEDVRLWMDGPDRIWVETECRVDGRTTSSLV